MLEAKWEKLGMEAQSPVASLEQRGRVRVAREACSSQGEWSAQCAAAPSSQTNIPLH